MAEVIIIMTESRIVAASKKLLQSGKSKLNHIRLSLPRTDQAEKEARRQRRLDRGAPSLRFWYLLLRQTLGERNLLPLSEEMRDRFVVKGLEYLPKEGVFTLAVNHTLKRWTPRLLSAVHHATMQTRPELALDWLVIVGYWRANLEAKPFAVRWVVERIRAFYTVAFDRWRYNCLRLPMQSTNSKNAQINLTALREWKGRAKKQPTIVFPEGIGARVFKEIRPGAGRWLANLGVPVLPVSVWWDSSLQLWHVGFGPTIEWSEDPELHDVQLGLEIALGLPPEEAPSWQEDLANWQAAWADSLAQKP